MGSDTLAWGAEHVLVVRANPTDPNFCLEQHRDLQRNGHPQKDPESPQGAPGTGLCPHLGLARAVWTTLGSP